MALNSIPARIRASPPMLRCRSNDIWSRSGRSMCRGTAGASATTRSRAKLSPPSIISRTAYGLQAVEISKPTGIGMIRPAQPQDLQPFANRQVGMGGLRFDLRADDIADQTVHLRSDPRVVSRIPPGPSP